MANGCKSAVSTVVLLPKNCLPNPNPCRINSRHTDLLTEIKKAAQKERVAETETKRLQGDGGRRRGQTKLTQINSGGY